MWMEEEEEEEEEEVVRKEEPRVRERGGALLRPLLHLVPQR
jgi:hypothetical protein